MGKTMVSCRFSLKPIQSLDSFQLQQGFPIGPMQILFESGTPGAVTNCSPFPGARLGIFGPCGWSRCFNKSWNGSGLGEIALADLVSPFSCCTWLLTKGYLLVGMRCLACDSLFRVEDSLSTLWLMGLDREFEKAWLLRLHWIEWDAKNQAIALLSIDRESSSSRMTWTLTMQIRTCQCSS